MTTKSPRELIAAGYRSPDPNSPAAIDQRRRLADQAALFRPNERMEGLLTLRQTDPATFARVIDAATLVALGLYLAGKQAAAQLEGTDDDAA